MSAIISKPFSWVNGIVRALFRGSPNLITTSDLNRQLEAFKKEMYLTQQGLGTIISDFTLTLKTGSANTYVAAGSYVYCAGVRFDIDLTNEYVFSGAGANKELRLYAKRTLITYEDDFSKNISGAKFTDGTTQPAADHYVYSEPEVALVDAATPNTNFEYPGNNSKEFVCTLARFHSAVAPALASYPKGTSVQLLTVPMGKNILDMGMKMDRFRQYTLPTLANIRNDLVPNADDTWQDCVHKLWSRQYALEKRLFNETNYGEDGVITGFSVNGVRFSANRRFSKTYTTQVDNFGTCELAYNFHLIGNICFVAGHATFEKNTMEDPLSKVVSFTIGTDVNEMPYSLYYMDTACALTVQNRPDINPSEAFLNARGYIDRNKIAFAGIPANGVTFYWYGMYCFSSRKFWGYAPDDRYGFFNDMR